MDSNKLGKKETSAILVIIIILITGLGAVYYVLNETSPGIEVSCESKTILGFKKVPPSLLQVQQSEICEVEVIIKYEDVIICSKKTKILNDERGVIECKKLDEFLNKTVNIKATFFNDVEEVIKIDLKDLHYNGI